ncbi:MAG: hypothetical protein RL326_894 [Pseudomonadota bacterium]
MGMFFYSVVGTLSRNLPPILEHNVAGKLRLGDFVLSLFLFSSGMSLAIVRSRHETLWRLPLWKSIAKRLGLMLFASAIITPFSVGAFGGMDEVMLNAALTIPTLLLASVGLAMNIAVIVSITLLYYTLPHFGVSVISSVEYLGGYKGAIFFLPVLAAGTLVYSSWRDRALRHSYIWALVTGGAWVLLGPPDKLLLTPSFTALSCLIGTATLYSLGRFSIGNTWMEYCGRHSLRMWCLMFVLLAPLRLYAETKLHARQLDFEPWTAVAIALLWMGISYASSRGWDHLGTLEKR